MRPEQAARIARALRDIADALEEETEGDGKRPRRAKAPRPVYRPQAAVTELDSARASAALRRLGFRETE